MLLMKKWQEKKDEEIRRLKAQGVKKAGLALVLGAAAAATVTLFTAPKSGKELRKDVADKVTEGAEIIKEKTEIISEKAQAVSEKGIAFGQSLKDKFLKDKTHPIGAEAQSAAPDDAPVQIPISEDTAPEPPEPPQEEA